MMNSTDWDRPGIIPGLQDQKRRVPTSRVSTGVFGYVADPDDPKSPPGLGGRNSRQSLDGQIETKHEKEVELKTASPSPPPTPQSAPEVRLQKQC